MNTMNHSIYNSFSSPTVLTRSRKRALLLLDDENGNAAASNISINSNALVVAANVHQDSDGNHHNAPRSKRRKIAPTTTGIVLRQQNPFQQTHHQWETSPVQQQQQQQQQQQASLVQQAHAGNVAAMRRLGHRYLTGGEQFTKNEMEGYKWLQRAHAAGDLWSTARVGLCLVQGQGVARNTTYGMYHLTTAAERGSDVAAKHVGTALADGLYGMPVDLSAAVVWLQRALQGDLPSQHLHEAGKAAVRTKLLQVQQQLQQQQRRPRRKFVVRGSSSTSTS